MIRNLLAVAAAIVSTLAAADMAQAKSVEGTSWDAKERFLIRARVIDVAPDEDSTTSIGGEIDADFAFTPEVDFS